MNEQLPPTDPSIREQLARRSAGRMPDGLTVEVLTAVDSAPDRRSIWRVPRVAIAGMSLAIVAVLVATIAFSATRTTPAASPLAGYPAERALTTAELASLMAGPALPVNAALVASVTIDVRNDVCPMNRYQTQGVVEGMRSQVCVMTSDVAVQPMTLTGTFAFRFLGSEYLLLLGPVTPASRRLAYNVADDWPGAGANFLVEGSLFGSGLVGNDPAGCPGTVPATDGTYSCTTNWLSDSASARPSQDTNGTPGAPAGARVVTLSPEIEVTPDPATGADTGIFVVAAATGPCPGASPQDSRGCGTWRVLARLADVSVPKPNPTAPTATAPTGYPVDRALTTAELAAVMAGPAPAVNTTLVAAVTIDSSEAGTPGCPMNDRPTIGAVRGMRTLVCVSGGRTTPARIPGIFAFRYLGPGALALLGQITPASSSRPVFGATGWPWSLNGWDTFLVGGYLIREPTGWRIADTLNGPTPSANTFPTVQVDAAAGIDSTDPSQYGVFVVICETVSFPASSMEPQGDGIAYHVLAKVADISVPGAATPPATPTAEPTANLAPGVVGRLGSGNRPLTVAEFPAAWAADPGHLAGKTVIVKGPVPTGFKCVSAATATGAVAPPGCQVATLDGQIAPEGYWAVLAGSDGRLSVIGAISVPQTGLVFSLDQVNTSTTLRAGDLVIVDGWLLERMLTCPYDATPFPAGCVVSEVGSTPQDQSPASVGVQLGAYEQMFATRGDIFANGPPVRGLYLIRLQNLGVGTLLARLESAALVLP